MQKVQHLLAKYNLRNTACRVDVISLFSEVQHALKHADIEKKMGEKYDRVTLYRTLNTFLESGIIHKVLDDEGVLKYAICKEECSSAKHNHNHIHFKCLSCLETVCISQTNISNIQLPAGYIISEVNILVQGTCKKCA